jgi:hypothetical protein
LDLRNGQPFGIDHFNNEKSMVKTHVDFMPQLISPKLEGIANDNTGFLFQTNNSLKCFLNDTYNNLNSS